MFKVDRHRLILAALARRRRVSLAELERELGATRITIQRDLVDLEKRGRLKRFHGGAMTADYDVDSFVHDDRLQVNRTAKKKIARTAMRLVAENSFVGLDGSSTTYFLAEEPFPAGVRVVTAGIDTFQRLQQQPTRVHTILTGGRTHPLTGTLVGPETISLINSFSYDIVFFSVFALNEHGLFDAQEDDAAVKRAFMQRAARKVLLFDCTKLDKKSGARVCTCDEIDLVITDRPLPPALEKIFRGRRLG